MNDENALKEKRNQLLTIVANRLSNDVHNSNQIATSLIDNFCELTPPEISTTFHCITMSNQGHGGGSSRKPGNIILNWRQLFTSVPNIVLTGAGVTTVPWLWPFAALFIWNEVWSQCKIELSPRHVDK